MRRPGTLTALIVVASCGRDPSRAHDAGARARDASPPIATVAFCGQTLSTAIRYVRCDDPSVVDLVPLARLRELTDLDLDRTGIHDLRPLVELTSLRRVSLRDTRVADLSGLDHAWLLETLDVSGAPVSTVGAASWPKLSRLDLHGTLVDGLAPFATLSNLEELDVSDTPVADLAPIARLPRLRRLRATGTRSSKLPTLAELAALEELDVGFSLLEDLGPMRAPALRTLRLTYSLVSNLDALATVGSLESVDVSYTLVTAETAAAARARLPRAKIHHIPWRGTVELLRKVILESK